MVASTLAAMALPAQAAISFTAPKALVGFDPPMPPTSLQFGPDGRLYVGLFDGRIGIYNVTRTGVGTYAVSGSPQILNQVSLIPNHDDDGSVNSGVGGRLLTGIAVAGTAANPVVYATSSDPRIGGGQEGADLNLDTNSGTVSRLTWTGSTWNHQVLVQGLPRSEENHGPNGLAVSGNSLYVAYGGHTNMGGPSFNFAFLPEYALSAAILKIDLANLGTLPYKVPTLDDPDRTATQESATDPFGGNSGKNQAKIVAGGPVQVFAPGFRNPYDVMLATVGSHAGKMYTVDNGGNGGWGDPPANEGPGGNCTNANVGQSATGQSDALHLVTQGYYGGHPNPTRGNISNTFAGQSPIVAENAVECDFRGSKTAESTALSTMPNSTNGIAEYTTTNFGGEMQGDLILASYQARKIIRVKLNSAGTAVQIKEDNFATFLQPHRPLDVTTVGPLGAFPGTIWIADISTNEILVMEPGDFGGGGGPTCTGADDPNLDEDGDGYDNADEIDNATNPCSAASQPPDNDGDHTSDLNDPNDDNDAQNDLVDPFQIDATNGKQRSLPVTISWENNDPPPGGIANSGFTGLMTNGSTDYLQMFDENNMTIGGAAGVTSVGQVPAGDAFKAFNSQEYGFQLGVDVPASGTFTASARIVAPFNGLEPWNHQAMGLFVGDGTQSNFVKIVTKGEGNSTSKSAVDVVNLVSESADVTGVDRKSSADMPAGVDWVDLFLTVDVDAGTVQGAYEVHRNGVPEPRVTMGAPIDVAWPLETASRGLAAGIISTSRGGAPPFPATWDFFHVEAGGGGGPTCTGANDPGLDEDGDGFDNATEIAAGSDPCDAGSVPSSADDDGDGLPDTTDPFALDAQNGLGNSVPFQISGNANQGGILQTGFTGLMVNGDDYSTLFSPADVTVNGNITVANIPNGDAAGTANQLHNGFQVGIVPPSQTFDVTTEIVAPFSGMEPINHQAMGLFIGDGTQNNFVKLMTKGASTDPDKINMLSEVGNAKQVNRNKGADFPGADKVVLTLRVNPGAGTVQGRYEVFRNGASEGLKTVGAAVPLQWSLSTASRGLAVGIMSSSTGPGGSFSATWDYLNVSLVG
jgi:hypothetical protein